MNTEEKQFWQSVLFAVMQKGKPDVEEATQEADKALEAMRKTFPDKRQLAIEQILRYINHVLSEGDNFMMSKDNIAKNNLIQTKEELKTWISNN